MSRIQQKITLLQELSENAFDISLQAGNMCLNTFCIDEEAGFELSGVYGLKKYKLRTRKKFGRLPGRYGQIHKYEKSVYKLGKDSKLKFLSKIFSRRHRES